MGNETANSSREQISVWKMLLRVGPGIVMCLALYSAGDLTLMSAMGARWGYNGLWLVVVALGGLLAFSTVTARYHLATGESIDWALTRTAGGRWITWYVAIGCLMATHCYNSYIIMGMGISWSFMFPAIPPKVWSIIWLIVALIVVGKGFYQRIEFILKICLAILAITVIYLFFAVRPSLLGILSSLIPRALPGGTVADTWGLALNVMGATTTSIIIIGYAYTIIEKGWSRMEDNRQMTVDALTACVLTFIFNTMLYAVAVEILRPRGIKVTKIDDVALVIGGQLGPMGYWIFYIALFAAVFSSLIGFSYYAALPARDAVSSIMGKRLDIKDRWFAFFMYISMILPLVWTFTKYGFVQLLMFFVPLLNYFFIIPLALVMALSNFKRFARDPSKFSLYRAAWWENFFLGVTLICVVYFCVQTFIKLFF